MAPRVCRLEKFHCVVNLRSHQYFVHVDHVVDTCLQVATPLIYTLMKAQCMYIEMKYSIFLQCIN